VPLFIGPADQAEVVVELVMALQPQEFLRGCFTPAADNPGHGDLAVVVADPSRHVAEEGEGPTMARLERLGTFAWEDLAEDGVRVQQRHHEQGHLRRLPAAQDHRLALVHLGFGRRVAQRHEDLGLPWPPGPHGALDHGLARAPGGADRRSPWPCVAASLAPCGPVRGSHG